MKQPALTHFLGYAYKITIPTSRKNKGETKISSCVIHKIFYIQWQGVANRGCSIRVGRETEKQGKGTTINIIGEQLLMSALFKS